MATSKKNTNRVGRPSPFENAPPLPPAKLSARKSTPVVPFDTALLTQRIEVLEKQLADEQAGRRADLERLLREIADLRVQIATLQANQQRDG